MTPVNAFTNTKTKLKMVRKGSTLTTYYNLGDGYILHSTVPNIFTGKLFVQLDLLSHLPDKPAVTALISSYSLSCIATNLTHTCSLDAKSVTLKWDASSFNYYTFGFNDQTNDNADGWYKPNTLDVWKGGNLDTASYQTNIIPGNKYNWWVGVDDEEVSKEFVCTPEASPIASITPKPQSPQNPRITCNPDGKSVRLQWDGVTDVDSYKVRLDDKNGKVTNFDNLKDPQYIATIVPEKLYSFWTHSSKNGLDSNQSTTIDFTCKATSTPTPTPKPTVKPTATPTIKPSPSPKPAVTIAPSPSSTQTSVNDLGLITPTPTPSTQPAISTNPVSRFFRWLASLFE
jgi:hypothetical protein